MKKGLWIIPLGLLVVSSGCGLPGFNKSKQTPKKHKKVAYRKTNKRLFESSLGGADEVASFVLEEPAESDSFSGDWAGDSQKVAQADSGKDLKWTEEQLINQFQTLLFDFDSDSIRPDQQTQLAFDEEVAKEVVRDGKNVVVEGHACHSAGSRAYNLAISERRAHNVSKKLADAGIPSSHIEVVGRGVEMPVVHGGDRVAQASNRRVEVHVV